MDDNAVFRRYIPRHGNNLCSSHGPRVRGAGTAFRSASPGMLPPLGILFALFVAFTAQQVWGDNDRASAAIDSEASALRAAVLLAAVWPGEPQARLRALIRRYIAEATNVEWPMMAKK